MKEMIEGGYRIEEAGTDALRGQLRLLWCEVFGDPPQYVDAVYRLFGDDIKGYVVTGPDGRAVSALSCYRCGEFEGRPVYVSYAVCTDESCRGLGLAGALTRHVRDRVVSGGGISLVSPAEPSLVGFYEKQGYEKFFYASVRSAIDPELDSEEYEDFDDYDLDFGTAASRRPSAKPELKVLSAEAYNRYREAFLSGRPHVCLSGPMLELIKSESLNGEGLLAVNGGDAVCAVSEAGPGSARITELLVNPVLLEISADIEGEIAAMIAAELGAAEAVYTVPGRAYCQSMAAGIRANRSDDGSAEEDNTANVSDDGSAAEGNTASGSDDGKAAEAPEDISEIYEYVFEEAYFGFPLD